MKWVLIYSFMIVGNAVLAQQSFNLFFEEFNDNSGNWPVGDRKRTNARIGEGSFYLEGKRVNVPYSRRIERGFLRPDQDYEISIKIRQVKGPENRAYALEWGGSSLQNSFYEFWVRKDGKFSIDFFNGETEQFTDFIGFTDSEAINRDGYNLLKVRKEGNRLIFYINGQEVFNMANRPLLGPEVGFIAPALGAVEVDYLRIDLLNSGPSSVFYQQSIPAIHVVIIGVADYQNDNQKLKDLQYTVNDARSVAQFYRSKNGGAVAESSLMLLLNEEATKQNILTRTKELFAKANPRDMIVFYFSGHGTLRSLDNQKQLHLLPYDFAFNDEDAAIPISEIEELFNNTVADKKMLILDACHSGGTMPKLTGRFKNHLATLTDKDIAILTSSDIDETSIEHSSIGEGGRGIFSYYLTNALTFHSNTCDTNDNGVVSILELFEYVRTSVNLRAKDFYHVQNPQIGGKFNVQLPIAEIKLK